METKNLKLYKVKLVVIFSNLYRYYKYIYIYIISNVYKDIYHPELQLKFEHSGTPATFLNFKHHDESKNVRL